MVESIKYLKKMQTHWGENKQTEYRCFIEKV